MEFSELPSAHRHEPAYRNRRGVASYCGLLSWRDKGIGPHLARQIKEIEEELTFMDMKDFKNPVLSVTVKNFSVRFIK